MQNMQWSIARLRRSSGIKEKVIPSRQAAPRYQDRLTQLIKDLRTDLGIVHSWKLPVWMHPDWKQTEPSISIEPMRWSWDGDIKKRMSHSNENTAF